MRPLFTSATIKLTAWYLAILVVISLLFSFLVYQLAVSELQSRLGIYESRLEAETPIVGFPDFTQLRHDQLQESKLTLFAALFYLNLVIVIAGGFGSYLLARRSLRPIEQSHELQARFASDASHELRTPLAVMKSEIEVTLRDKTAPKEVLRETLESNLEEVNRLSALSQTLLQLSKQDHASLPMKRVDIHSLLADTLKTPALNKTRIDFTPSSKKAYVNANHESLTELFMILIDNALRYSPDGSIVTISTQMTKSHVRVFVENTGEGIAPKDLPHVFERFYRGSKSRSSTLSTGYGLGLSLAKQIADRHDGEITIASDPGKMTTTTVILPKFSIKQKF